MLFERQAFVTQFSTRNISRKNHAHYVCFGFLASVFIPWTNVVRLLQLSNMISFTDAFNHDEYPIPRSNTRY